MKLFVRLLMVFFLFVCFGCQSVEKPIEKVEYLRFVGDIKSDSILDDSNFKTCLEDGPVMQYFNTMEGFRFKGEKPELIRTIKSKYKPAGDMVNQTGYIRIRFIINCEGEAGRFRILTSDRNFKPVNFNAELTNQLVRILSELDGWQKMIKDETTLDYYTYLIFKLENGNIKEILP